MSLTQKIKEAYASLRRAASVGHETQIAEDKRFAAVLKMDNFEELPPGISRPVALVAMTYKKLNPFHPLRIAYESGVNTALSIPFEDYLKEQLITQ